MAFLWLAWLYQGPNMRPPTDSQVMRLVLQEYTIPPDRYAFAIYMHTVSTGDKTQAATLAASAYHTANKAA